MSTEHPRAEIRHAVAANLGAANATSCGDRVFASRTAPLVRDSLPAILVYEMPETIDKSDSSVWTDPDNPGILKRELQLGIEIVAKGERADDELDRIALEVETVMDADPSLGRRAESLMLSGTDFAFYDSGEDLIGALRLTYDIVYRTKTITVEGDAGVPITMVLGSWAPDIGAAHVDDYVDITEGGVPPVGGGA